MDMAPAQTMPDSMFVCVRNLTPRAWWRVWAREDIDVAVGFDPGKAPPSDHNERYHLVHGAQFTVPAQSTRCVKVRRPAYGTLNVSTLDNTDYFIGGVAVCPPAARPRPDRVDYTFKYTGRGTGRCERVRPGAGYRP